MATQTKEYGAHVLAIPWPAPGHMNPLLQLCKRLVLKGGIKATFAITKFQSKSMYSTLDYIQVDTISDGYDEGGFFIVDGITASVEKFKAAGSESLAELIRKHEGLGQPFDCIIYDAFLPWVLDVAGEFGISTAAFFTQKCSVNCINHHVLKKLIPYPFTSEPISIPGLPLLNIEDMPGFIHVDPELYELVQSQFSTPELADYRLVNTFYELESEAVEAMSKIHSLRTIGPTIPSFYLDKRIENDSSYGLHATHLMFQEKNASRVEPSVVLNWLDAKPTGSVVYVSFGSVSIASPGPDEMKEIAFGLKNTNFHFLWVVKPNEEPNLPENFKEEMADKGLIVSWSPQLEVLAHKALGCFVTHCGWNSTIESLCMGVPMVAVPKWADQPTNAKYVEDVWKVGIRVKVDENRFAGRDEVERCIRAVMEGERAEDLKRSALKWKELCIKAVAEGGSSDKNMEEFASELITRKSASK